MTQNVYNPSAFENNSGWTGPEYAYSSNNLYAYTTTKAASIDYMTYGITEEAGESVTTVEIGIEAYGDGDDYLNISVSWDGGTSWTSPIGHVPPTTDPDAPTYIDVTSGRGWTWDELSNTNFRVRVGFVEVAKGGDMYIDWLPARITSEAGAVWKQMQYDSEPPSVGWNPLKYASGTPVPAAWNKLVYEGE